MPRNMIDANRELFARLAAAGGDSITADVRNQRRAVQTRDSDKEWLKYLDFSVNPHLRLDSTSSFALARFAGDSFLVAIAVEINNPPVELERVTINAGAFTAIVYALNVPIIRSPSLPDQLMEYVFYPIEHGIELIDMEVVAPFFQRIDLFRIAPESAIASEHGLGIRSAIAAVLSAPSSRPLDWSQDALDRFGYMARDPMERSPFHLLFRALTESRDDAAFLALYRCIEQLFPIPAMGSLSAELGISQPALEVAATIERHLGWRRREDDAIAGLFSIFNDEIINRFIKVLGAEVQDQNRHRTVSKKIYELRNQCVHFRPAHALGEPSFVGAWASLTELMLEAVQTLYANYHSAFVVTTQNPAEADIPT